MMRALLSLLCCGFVLAQAPVHGQSIGQLTETRSFFADSFSPPLVVANGGAVVSDCAIEDEATLSGMAGPCRVAFPGAAPEFIQLALSSLSPRPVLLGVDASGSLFLVGSSLDLTGQNPDLGFELFLADATHGFSQVTDRIDGAPISTAALSGDGSSVVYVTDVDCGQPQLCPEIVAVDADGSAAIQLTSFGGPAPLNLKSSDDGQRILFEWDGEVYGVERDGTGLRSFGGISSFWNSESFDLSADGSTVALGSVTFAGGTSRDYGFRTFEWDGTLRHDHSAIGFGTGGGSNRVYLSADGSQVLYRGAQTYFSRLPGSVEFAFSFDFHDAPMRLSPDGGQAVYISGGTSLFGFSTTDFTVEVVYFGDPALQSPSSPSISAAGDRAAYYSQFGGVLSTVIVDLGDRSIVEVINDVSIGWLSADGTRLLLDNASYTLGTNTAPVPIPGAVGTPQSIQSGLDGTLLITTTAGDYYLGDLAGVSLVTSCSAPANCADVRLSADGSWYVRSQDGSILLARSDGSTEQQVGMSWESLDLSADGSRIAFASSADLTGNNADLNQELFLLDTTTDLVTQLTDTTAVTNDAPRFAERPLTFYFRRDGQPRWIDSTQGLDIALDLYPDTLVAANGDFLSVAAGDFAGTNPLADVEVWHFDADGPSFVLSGGATTTLTPTAGIGSQDLIRGDLAALGFDGAGDVDLGAVTCLAEDTATALDDSDLPAPGAGFFYLGRSLGSYGAASDGSPRQAGGGDCLP